MVTTTPKFKPSKHPIDSSVDSRVAKRRRVESQYLVESEEPDFIESPVVIASDLTLESLFEKFRTPSGVRYEIARLLSTKSKEYTPERFKESLEAVASVTNTSKKPNVDGMARLNSSINVKLDGRISDREYSATAPWAELDLEESVLSRDPLGGLGLTSLTSDELNVFGGGLLESERASNFYYGGKIDFIARVDKEGLRIRLERAAKGPSNKAKRRFGSIGFLKVKIPMGTFKSQSDIERFFQRPFILWGSVYRAILGKEDAVILFRTNERYVNGRLRTDPDSKSMSLYSFIHWFNPPEYNAEQVLCKWASRMALLWSSSVPGPQLARKHIHFIGDEVSSEGSDMTDGCGYGNRSLFKAIQQKFGLEEMPCAVQCRVVGSKGMIVFSEEVEDDGSPHVWLRGSQRKVRYPPSLAKDPSHRIMDILRVSRVRAPARLSVEVIVNLQHNGCPSSYFTSLLKSNLEDAVNPMLAWDIEKDPAAMLKLWHTIEQAEHVLVARRARESATESRFRGYSERVNEEPLDDEDPLDEVNDDQRSTAWWPDPNSGCPSSIAETVMGLLVAGFTPQTCAFMRDKISRLVTSQINRKCTKYNFDVKMSASAFAVPDPYGVLREGEIHFKSSRRDFKTQEGSMTDVLEGPVLVTRNPCKVPTDVQKFTAVIHPQLAHLVNCVVFSIKGARRPIDKLAGGDYDGDRVTVLYDPELVEGFKNADEKYSTEPPEVKTAFTLEHSLTVHQFNAEVPGTSDLKVSVELQKSLLGGLRDPYLIGMYSFLHEKCVYVYGYAHPITIKTAYKFCAVMDGPKSGRRIVARVLSEDKGRFPNSQKLPWKHRIELMNSKLKDRSIGAGKTELLHRQVSSPFVMDMLASEAEGLHRQWMAQTEAIFFENSHAICQTFSRGADKDLLAPWEFYRSKAVGRPGLANDLRIISNHVEDLIEEHSNKCTGRSFTEQEIVKRQDTLRGLSKAFNCFPTPDDLEAVMDQDTIACLRASCAYNSIKSSTGRQGPWLIAFNELCLIKAKASKSGFKAIITDFADVFKVSKAVLERT